VRWLRRSLASSPEDARLHCLMAQATLACGRPADALKAAETAAALTADEEWPQRLRAIALGGLKRPSEAVRAAVDAVRLGPDTPQAHLVLAESQLADRQVDAARRTTARLVELAPDWAATHDLLGRIALARHQGADAEEHFRRALALDPQDAAIHNNLGAALGAQGRSKESIDAYHAAARLDPRFDLARRNLARSTAVYVGAAGLGIVGLVAAQVLRVILQPLVEGLTGNAQSLFIVAALVFLAAGLTFGFLWHRRNRRRLDALDPAVRQFHLAEKAAERRRNLRFLPFYAAGTLLTLGIMFALLLSVEFWWLLGVVLVFAWVIGAKPAWSRWVEPWWDRRR
jgi:Flp pilus assembly protein TadD